MDIMLTKNEIVWIDGMPCIKLDEGIKMKEESDCRGPPIPTDGPHKPPHEEVWEFTVHFLPPNEFSTIQEIKEKHFFEDILKELKESFEEK